MSATSTRIPIAEAREIAARLVELIDPYCERSEVAGSLRRRLPTVGDIEVVAIPKVDTVPEVDMFGQVVATDHVDLLDVRLTRLLDQGIVAKRLRSDGKTVWGQKMKYLTFDGVNVDLFTPEVARFGLILMIRTGPAAYSHQLVTEKGKALVVGFDQRGRPIKRIGLLPVHLRVTNGWLTYRTSGQRIETPEETDVYEAIGVPYRDPWERR